MVWGINWDTCTMFASAVSHQFLKKLQPFLGSVVTRSSSSQKLAQHRKVKKPPKLKVKKHNVEPKVYKRDIIINIYNILKYSTWDSAKIELENLSINWESFTVNQVLKTHPPMEKAWLFFNWASWKKNFKHDQYTYTTMMDIFGEAKRIQSMKFVFEQMKLKGTKIDVVTYTSLMHWMSNDGDIDGAIELWKEMRAKGCRPTVVSYTAYMKILFDHKRVNEATGVYKEMLESGLPPNCYTYTILMEYLASSGKSKEAIEIFQKMQDAGVQPDKATCNILIEIFCRIGETGAIMEVLEYMKEKFLVLRYPVYQKALGTFKMSKESDMLLRQVNRHFPEEHSNQKDTDRYGVVSPGLDYIMENGLVLNLIKKQNLIAVDFLLTDMLRIGVPLDTNVISRIIEVNSSRRRQNGALLAYEYGVKLGINIEKMAYLGLIGLFTRTSSFPKVVEIVEEMVKKGISLGTHLNALLIYRLGCNRDLVSATKIFNLIRKEERSSAEYTALIAAYFSSGNADKGLKTFEIMKSEGVNVALGTYCVLVAGLENCGKVGEMENFCKEKKRLERGSYSQNVSMEEMICNLLFSRGSTC